MSDGNVSQKPVAKVFDPTQEARQILNKVNEVFDEPVNSHVHDKALQNMLDELSTSSPFHQNLVKQELTGLASSGSRDLPQVTLDFGDDGIRFKPNKQDTKNERLELHYVSKHGKKSELYDPAQAAKDLMIQARLAIDEPEGTTTSLDKLQTKFLEMFSGSDEYQADVVSQLSGRFGGLLSDRPKDEQPLPVASVQIGDGKLTGICFKASGYDDSKKHDKLAIEWNRDKTK